MSESFSVGAISARCRSAVPARIDEFAAWRRSHKSPANHCRSVDIVHIGPGGMVLKEYSPCLARWFSMPDHVLGNGGFTDLDPELQQFTMGSRRASKTTKRDRQRKYQASNSLQFTQNIKSRLYGWFIALFLTTGSGNPVLRSPVRVSRISWLGAALKAIRDDLRGPLFAIIAGVRKCWF